MQWLAEYGLFLAKTVTWVVAVLIVMVGIASIFLRGKDRAEGRILVKKLNEKYREMAHALQKQLLSKKDYKALCKMEEKAAKEREQDQNRKRLFVINFHGDVRASAVHNLREEVSAILSVARPNDEVVVRLESVGGSVNSYGLAASQLARLKQKNIPLTISVDKVAASGGYMMACVADKILAAPFAIVGSIGVVAQLPNFHRWLKQNAIDIELHTAGEYKRTLTLFGENTDKDRQKFQEELEEIHQMFKEFLIKYRPHLDLNRIATGEHWLGTRALELQLVDELMTSDDYLLTASQEYDIFRVKYEAKKPFGKKVTHFIEGLLARLGYSQHYLL